MPNAGNSTLAGAASMRTGTGSLFFQIAITVIALTSRLDWNDIPNSLYNEDGRMFLNDAYRLGVDSVFQPLNGYLGVYIRLVSLIATALPLEYVPYLFFCGYLLAFLTIVGALYERSEIVGLDNIVTTVVLITIALQPSHGEPFFNLTHANFALGIALAIYVLIPSRAPPSPIEMLVVALGSLTGPFPVFFAPLLAAQWIILRDFHTRKVTYVIVALCTSLQLYCMLDSPRIASTATDTNPQTWLRALLALWRFGSDDYLSLIPAVLFWTIGVIFISRSISEFWKADRPRVLAIVCCVAGAATIYLIGCLATGEYLPTFSPLNMHSRYFLIPYSLLFVAVFSSVSTHRSVLIVQSCLLASMCASAPLNVFRSDRGSSTGLLHHENMQWNAFARFHDTNPDLVIPINSNWPTDPPFWNVSASSASPRKRIRDAPALTLGPGIDDAEYEEHFSDAHSPIELTFNIGGHCRRHRFLAIEADVWRDRMGWTKLMWGTGGQMLEDQSLRRFYRAGSVTMQFAFERNLSDQSISLKLSEGVPDSVMLHLLSAAFKSSSILVGQPTPSGGRVIVRELRVFCL